MKRAIEVDDGWVYETYDDNRCRYILGKPGRNNLVCVGVKFDRWRHAGPLTKMGHPHHPLFLATNASFEPFVIEDYLQKIDAGKRPSV